MSGARRLAWTGLIALAFVGVVAFQLAGTPLTAYPVEWQQATYEPVTQDGTLEEGEQRDVEFTLDRPNVTQIQASVDWTDDTGEPDRFRVTLVAPNGSRVARDDGTAGPIEATEVLTEVPDRETIRATSQKAARRQLVSDHATSPGGTWTVTVELVEAPGTQAPAGGPETQEDGANDFSLSVEVGTYRATVGDA